MKRRRVSVTLALVITCLLLPLQTTSASTVATTCREVSIPVHAHQAGHISGTLCVPPNASTVQVLTPGWTYGRYYWDFPYQPDTYSYVRQANRAGYATLNIDRWGTGQSTHPLSALDTFYADGKTLHQTIQALRSGGTGTRFDKVISVGHSLGSMVAMIEAGRYKDVDALATTGIVHSGNYINFGRKVVAVDEPALLDKKFSNRRLDPGYVTSYPGTRGNFYNPTGLDKNVVDIDERMKHSGSLVEVATFLGFNILNTTRTLNVPVFGVLGEKDPLICGLTSADCTSSKAIADFERPFYGSGATVEGRLEPASGHNLQLQQSAPKTTEALLSFSDRHAGSGSGIKGTVPGHLQPRVPPPSPAPSPAAEAVNQTVSHAVAPLIQALTSTADVVPGLGTHVNPIPNYNGLVAPVANFVDRTVGPIPEDLLAGP